MLWDLARTRHAPDRKGDAEGMRRKPDRLRVSLVTAVLPKGR